MNFTKDYIRTSYFSMSIPILNFTTSVIVARFLGVSGKGIVSAVGLWSQLADWLFALGIPLSTLVISRRKQLNSRQVFGAAIVIGFLLSFLKTSILEVVATEILHQYPTDVIRYARFVWLIGCTGIPISIATSILQYNQKVTGINILRIVGPGLSMLVVLVFYVFHYLTWRSVLVLQGLINPILFLVLFWQVRRDIEFSATYFSRHVRELFSYGIKVHIGEMASAINGMLDSSIVSVTLNPSELGLYSVATNVSRLPESITNNTANVVTLSASVGSGKSRIVKFVSWSNMFSLFLTIGGLVLFLVMGKYTLLFLYGSSFTAVYPISLILLIGSIFSGLSGNLTQGLYALERPLSTSFTEGISLVTLSLALIFFLPTWHIYGAAMSVVAAKFVKLTVTVWYLGVVSNTKFYKLLFPSMLDLSSALKPLMRGK